MKARLTDVINALTAPVWRPLNSKCYRETAIEVANHHYSCEKQMNLGTKTKISWATFSLASIIAMVSIVAFVDADVVIEQFSLIPAQA